MFTGIVQGKGHIQRIHKGQKLNSLVIELPAALVQAVTIGASVAVNGTCLTVTEQQGNALYFDVIEQTLDLTNLGNLATGDEVNIERSLKIGDELGGHLISGHITTTLNVNEVVQEPENTTIWFDLPASQNKHILPQGYVGLNGCSLTIAKVEKARFCVCLIPETLRITTFGSTKVGDAINMEIDHHTQTIVATVERVLAQQQS